MEPFIVHIIIPESLGLIMGIYIGIMMIRYIVKSIP